MVDATIEAVVVDLAAAAEDLLVEGGGGGAGRAAATLFDVASELPAARNPPPVGAMVARLALAGPLASSDESDRKHDERVERGVTKTEEERAEGGERRSAPLKR